MGISARINAIGPLECVRRPALVVDAALHVSAAILAIFAILGLTEGGMDSFPWGEYRTNASAIASVNASLSSRVPAGAELEIHINIWGACAYVTLESVAFVFGRRRCASWSDFTSRIVTIQECEDASKSLTVNVIVAFVSQLFKSFGFRKRWRRECDRNVKLFNLITCVLPLILASIATAGFQSACINGSSDPVAVDSKAGAGFILFIASFLLNIPSFFIQLLIPTAPPEKQTDAKAEPGDVQVWSNIRRTADRPCRCCCQACLVWVLGVVLLGAAQASGDFITFNLDVPFYNRAEINRAQQDAIWEMRRDANVLSLLTSSNNSSCVNPGDAIARNGTILGDSPPSDDCQTASSQLFRILYISSDRKSSILTPENIEAIRRIEERVLSEEQLTKYCNLVQTRLPPVQRSRVKEAASVFVDPNQATLSPQDVAAARQEFRNLTLHPACARISSMLYLTDSWYFDYTYNSGAGYYLLKEDVVESHFNVSQSNIDHVAQFWGGYSSTTYNLGSSAEFSLPSSEILVPNLMSYVTSTDFPTNSSTAIGLMSILRLGLPIDGYQYASESKEDQYEKVGEWLHDTFDGYFKGLAVDGIDIYWGDNKGGMTSKESGILAFQSLGLLAFSVAFVYLYLAVMLDSFFLATMAVMQIFLCFVPALLIYSYIFQQKYFGVLNMISIFIILGIGVDDVFVFCDQFQLQRGRSNPQQRLQRTYSVAGKAMFTTSATTFVSFLSNSTSAFPAVQTFGLFSAALVFCNFSAVVTFWPAVVSVHDRYVSEWKFDHPSALCKRCKKSSDHSDVHESSSTLAHFFEHTWAPRIIRFRCPIVASFLAIFVGALAITAAGLKPDTEFPNTLPESNNYRKVSDVLLDYFVRTSSPTSIEMHLVGGITPDDPIDREGADPTNITDVGTPIYADCASYNPTTKAAQIWLLNLCHDTFFGNVTAYHGSDLTKFVDGGAAGPTARRVLEAGRVTATSQYYYDLLTCPIQGFRDWLLTPSGCTALTSFGLECVNVTLQRSGCTFWSESNSCEPFPVPAGHFVPLLAEMLADDGKINSDGQTFYDVYSDFVLVDYVAEDDVASADVDDNNTCRHYDLQTGATVVLRGLDAKVKLVQEIAQDYNDGLSLYEVWVDWHTQMLANAPAEMAANIQQTENAWSFYFLNQKLISETFTSVATALILSYIILTCTTLNPLTALYSVLTIILIIGDVFAFTVIVGFDLGVLEAVNYVVVIGMSIDYCVHMSEAYLESHHQTRKERVKDMLAEMGVSVLSGAISTLGCIFFMFFAPNTFFFKFACFFTATILLSCVYSLVFYPALLAIIGPNGHTGDLSHILCQKKNSKKLAETTTAHKKHSDDVQAYDSSVP